MSGLSGGSIAGGSGIIGNELLLAATTVAAQNLLGGTTIGKALFTASTTAAAKQLLNQGGQANAIIVSAAISAGSVSLPANSFLQHIIVHERAAAAVTGGLQFGTAATQGDVVSALAVGANGNVFVTDAALLKRFFSVAAAQAINYDAVTAWNAANVNIIFVYGKL